MVSAQLDWSYFIYPQGSDCDGSEVEFSSGTYPVETIGVCKEVGYTNYDIRMGWVIIDGEVPPVYACPDSTCSSGCALLWGAGSQTGDGDSSCENVSNGPYLLVDGET